METVDEEDSWGKDYASQSEKIRRIIDSLPQALGKEVPEEVEEPKASIKPEKGRFSVPHASRDPDILRDKHL